MQLSAKYRPKTWSDVVGQDAVVKRLSHLADRGGLGGRAYFLSGHSGTGKSAIARLIAAEVADPPGLIERDANELSGDDIREIERQHRLRGPLGSTKGWAVLINEAQGLKPNAVKQLLLTLDPDRLADFPHVCWILTTIDSDESSLFGMDVAGHPLLSRCNDCTLARGEQLVLPFARIPRIRRMAFRLARNNRQRGVDSETHTTRRSVRRNGTCGAVNPPDRGELA